MQTIKRSTTFFIAIVAFLAFSGFQIAKADEVKIKTSAVCGSCEVTLKTALSKVDGVKSASLNIETAVLTVKYDGDKTNIDAIRTAITKAGYDADDMPADAGAYENLHSCCKKDAVH